jgi:hypothetical protein
MALRGSEYSRFSHRLQSSLCDWWIVQKHIQKHKTVCLVNLDSLNYFHSAFCSHSKLKLNITSEHLWRQLVSRSFIRNLKTLQVSVDVTNRCGSLLNKQIVTWHPHSEPLTRQARGWQLDAFPLSHATKEQEVVQGRARRWKECVRK